MNLIPVSLCTMFFAPLALAVDEAVAASRGASAEISGVGSVIDPAGDCRVVGTAARLTITIPGSDHALMTEQNRMAAPRVLQEVTGDFSAEATVSGSYPENANTVVPGRRPFQGAGLLLWVDQHTYIRLERAQIRAEVNGTSKHFSYPNWELRVEGKSLRAGSGSDGTLATPATTFRLARSGNKVVASVSDDGTVWRELEPLTVKLPEKVQIGVVAGHNTTAPFEAIFANFKTTPLGTEKK